MTEGKKKQDWRTAKRQRNERITLWAYPHEKERLKETASAAGLSMGAYVRQLVFGAKAPQPSKVAAVDRELLVKYLGQIGKIGSNLNQIARHMNTMGAAPPMSILEEELAELKELRKLIKNALHPS